MRGKMSGDSIKRDNQAIITTDLTKWFGEGDTKMTAVNNVKLVVHFGEMLFIVGPSGSGKTTMLSMISGILRRNAGGWRCRYRNQKGGGDEKNYYVGNSIGDNACIYWRMLLAR
jgi:ABC-type antimicrobial peptide transport system, ATPase component